jgi:hypothetical protein
MPFRASIAKRQPIVRSIAASNVVKRIPLYYGVFVGVLLAFALALAFAFVLVVAGVIAGVAAGVGVLVAALLAVLFAGAGPHPPWHPYATTVKMRTSESAIAFFILMFYLLSSSKIRINVSFASPRNRTNLKNVRANANIEIAKTLVN